MFFSPRTLPVEDGDGGNWVGLDSGMASDMDPQETLLDPALPDHRVLEAK